MVQANDVAPILKWVGGKRQLLAALTGLLPESFNAYCEPFLGGGAMLFHLQPEKVYVNDINNDLIRVYEVVRDSVEELIFELKKYQNTSEFYYFIRGLDRNQAEYALLSNVEKAARVIYLNKTCYNGLYRVNSAGEFNSPFGNYKNPNIVNEEMLRNVSKYFNNVDIRFTAGHYASALDLLQRDDFVYLDPPYDPVSSTANFTGYSSGGFSRDDQIKLRGHCDDLDRRGIKFMLSNSATEFILNEYANYNIQFVQARRAINSVASARGVVPEVVVRNYG